MTINIKALKAEDRKGALNILCKCIEDSLSETIKNALENEGVTDIMKLLTLRNDDIDHMTVNDNVTPLSKAITSQIKDLRDFTVHLMTDSALKQMRSVKKQPL